MKRTFQEWMHVVSAEIEALTGLWAEDLPDVCYRDWYEDGVGPKSAARRAIRYATEG